MSSGAGHISNNYSEELKKRLLAEHTLPEIEQLGEEFISLAGQENNLDVLPKAGWPLSTYKVSKVLLNCYTRYLHKHNPNIFVAAGKKNEKFFSRILFLTTVPIFVRSLSWLVQNWHGRRKVSWYNNLLFPIESIDRQFVSTSASRSAAEGADVIHWLATAPVNEIGSNGSFWRDRKLIEWWTQTQVQKLQKSIPIENKTSIFFNITSQEKILLYLSFECLDCPFDDLKFQKLG